MERNRIKLRFEILVIKSDGQKPKYGRTKMTILLDAAVFIWKGN